MAAIMVTLTREDGTTVQREFESTEAFTVWWDTNDEALEFDGHDAKGVI